MQMAGLKAVIPPLGYPYSCCTAAKRWVDFTIATLIVRQMLIGSGTSSSYHYVGAEARFS